MELVSFFVKELKTPIFYRNLMYNFNFNMVIEIDHFMACIGGFGTPEMVNTLNLGIYGHVKGTNCGPPFHESIRHHNHSMVNGHYYYIRNFN